MEGPSYSTAAYKHLKLLQISTFVLIIHFGTCGHVHDPSIAAIEQVSKSTGQMLVGIDEVDTPVSKEILAHKYMHRAGDYFIFTFFVDSSEISVMVHIS